MMVSHFYVEAESAVHERFESRAQIQTLMSVVRDGDLIVCDKIDRWSRDPEFTYSSVRRIKEAGAAFYSVSEQCDPATPEGDTMLNFRVLFAKEEHKRIKERMVGTRRKLRDRGYYVEGLAPFGYRRPLAKGQKGDTKNVLAIEPKEATIVRRAFRMSIAGRSIAHIAAALELQRDRIGKMLRNRVYLGEIQNTQHRWIRALHDPIVDADTFEQSRVAREGRILGGVRPAGAEVETGSWFLRDVARCFHCDARMGASYAGPKTAARRYYYRCTARCTSLFVNVRKVEQLADELIVSRLQELREELAKGPEVVNGPKVDTTARRAKLTAKRARYVEMYGDGAINRDLFRSELAKLDAAQLKLDGEDASAKRVSPLIDKVVRREVLREVGVIERDWGRSNPTVRRAIVNHLCLAVRMAANSPPKPVWRSNDDLAAEVRP